MEQGIGLRPDEDTDDFIYSVVVVRPYLGPMIVDSRIPVEDGTADCSRLTYGAAKHAGKELEEKGYDVEYPDPPFYIRWLRRLGMDA